MKKVESETYVQEVLEEITQERKRASRKASLFTLGVAVLVLGYGYLTLQKIKSNFTQEAIQKEISHKIAEISPFMHVYLSDAMEGIPEVYRDAFISEMKNKMPEFQANLMHEVEVTKDYILNEFQKNLDQKLSSSFIRAQEDKMLMASGDELDPAQLAEDKAYFGTELNRILKEVRGRFINNFNSDFEQIATVLETFPRQSEAALDEGQAKKMFVHFWLQLVDKQLMNDKGGLL